MLLRRDAETNQHSFSRSVDTHLQAEKLRKATELPSGEKALETSTWIPFGESFYEERAFARNAVCLSCHAMIFRMRINCGR